jgi:hypothetical protein
MSPGYVVSAVSLTELDFQTFPKALLNPEVCEKTNPVCWWSSVSKISNLSNGFIEMAQKLMVLPASTAGLERNFSTLSRIITKPRNRLGLDKSSKLCFAYQYFRRNQLKYSECVDSSAESDNSETPHRSKSSH